MLEDKPILCVCHSDDDATDGTLHLAEWVLKRGQYFDFRISATTLCGLKANMDNCWGYTARALMYNHIWNGFCHICREKYLAENFPLNKGIR